MKRTLHDFLARAWASPPAQAPGGTWILAAAESLYRCGLRLDLRRPRPAPLPVVSVGSLLAGGAGKTPLAALLARLAREEGLRPAILLRGYGGRPGGKSRAVPASPGAGDVALFGDEACLHARWGDAAVYTGADRLASAILAYAEGCGIAILDDGFQHRAIARDWEIVTLPAERPLGNGRLLPRGPLRAGEAALARAQLIVLSHAGSAIPPPATIALLDRLAPGVPRVSWKPKLALRGLTGEPPAGSGVALMCGIGRPEGFRAAMTRAGFDVAWVEAFPDHHRFRQAEIDRVRRRAEADKVRWIVTTAKDEMRLLGLRLGVEPGFACADLGLLWNEADAESRLRAGLARIGRGRA